MSEPKPVLVIGGTRGTGLLIARELLRAGSAVRVLARNPERAAQQLDPAAEIVQGDITRPETLAAAVAGISAIVFTAGCRSGRPASESSIKATEYEGVRNVIAAARSAGFRGRFLYMTASGGTKRSLLARALNLYKGKTLTWRLRAESVIRNSALDYTIIRAGVLVNQPAGRHRILITQKALPLSIRNRIARGDVANAFVAALRHPGASRSTFEIVWRQRGEPEPWSVLLAGLEPDRE